MRYSTDQTPRTGQQHGRPHAILRWWNSPAAFHSGRRRRIWIALAIALLSLVVAIAATSLWNYYGLSLPIPKPTTGITAPETGSVVGPVRRPSAAIEWNHDPGAPLSAQPVAVDGEIYIVSGSTVDTGAVASLTESNGSLLWEVKLDSISDYSPVVAGEIVFAGTRSGNLVALDRDTGNKVWEFDLGSSAVGSPIIHGGVLYAASNDVYAIDAATGEHLWTHNVGGDVSRPLRLSEQIIAAISSDGNVNLIRADNGRRRLTFPLWFSTSAAPTVSGTTLVVPGDRAFVQALDVTQRDVPMEKAVRYWWTKLWLWDMAPRPPLPRAYAWQNRTIDGDTAYALGADQDSVYLGVSEIDGTGTIVALDLSTGEPLWETPAASSVLHPAIMADDALIVGIEQSGVVAIDKITGAVIWELPIEGGLSAAPKLTDTGLLLVPTNDNGLKTFR